MTGLGNGLKNWKENKSSGYPVCRREEKELSKSVQENITCPNCGKDSEFTIWQSINTQLDPEMKIAVRDKSIFRFTCPHCGHTALVDYGFLYHQMEDRIMIHYVQSEEDVKQIYDLYTGNCNNPLFKSFPILQAHYLNRIVRSMNQLLEKLAIFDAGLDDRIIEICKVFITAEYLKQHPDSAGAEMLMYTGEKGEHIIEILENAQLAGSYELSDDMYNTVKKHFSPYLKDMRDEKEPIINQTWALRFLDENASG